MNHSWTVTEFGVVDDTEKSIFQKARAVFSLHRVVKSNAKADVEIRLHFVPDPCP